MSTPVDTAEQAARTVRDSRAVEVLARLGLASRGLVWLVPGLLAASLVGGGDAQADQTGALKQLVEAPLGRPLLLVLAVGFAGYATWLVLEAAVSRDKAPHRIKSGLKALVYAALCVSTLQFLERGEGDESTTSRTADLMSRSGGRTAVAAVGVVLLGMGAYFVVKGVRRKHAECLEHYRVPDRLRRPAILVGAVGYVGRGVTFGLIGAFLVKAAVQFDPAQAKGLDAALQAVADQQYGQILLGLTVVGVLAYALWSFFEAAYRDF